MRGMQALSAGACFTAVTAFVPSPFECSRLPCPGVHSGTRSCATLATLKHQSMDEVGVFSFNAGEGDNVASRPRATLPVVIVGSDRATLEKFAQHLTKGNASRVVDLGEVAKSEGVRGVEIAITEGDTGEVLMCSSMLCLDHPDVTNLVREHPLTVHLAGDDEDPEQRRQCEQATKYTIMIDHDDGEHTPAKDDLSRLVAFARRSKPSKEEVSLGMGKNTFFLALTFEDFAPHVDLLQDLSEGVDALELRVDLLADHNPYSVLQQLSILRRHTNYLPIVFTVRSKGQCGAFPENPDALFSLARWGLRAGCEVVDVESNWPMSYRESFIREASDDYPGAVLVGSYHVMGRKTTEDQARALFKECYHGGTVDAVKVVTTAFEPQDSIRIHNAAESLSLPVPYIALCLTETGKLSRVLNERFTPVTHEKLPFAAAPGQLSSREIMRLRAGLGICPPRSFFLFGSPISASPSPDMHNAGFRVSGLPYEYYLCEGEDTAVMVGALARPDFGGASVTIPHKQNILPLLDDVSDAAEKIGAVNTVIVETDQATGARRLRGDNTDWLGIMRPVKARLMTSGWEEEKGGIALVVGAGGAAMGALFAIQRLGLQVVVYNRTPLKAEELARRFGGVAVSSLDADTIQGAYGTATVDVVVSTIPAAAGFTLPEYLIENKPVVFDAAYKPELTSLLAQAKQAGCPYVQGADMLVEQGLEQFQLWTRRRAPRQAMEAAVFAKELTKYQGQDVEADVCGFSLSGFWLRKSEPTLAQGTGELVEPPDLPHLALLARL